jgi:hypothetical protein
MDAPVAVGAALGSVDELHPRELVDEALADLGDGLFADTEPPGRDGVGFGAGADGGDRLG